MKKLMLLILVCTVLTGCRKIIDNPIEGYCKCEVIGCSHTEDNPQHKITILCNGELYEYYDTHCREGHVWALVVNDKVLAVY